MKHKNNNDIVPYIFLSVVGVIMAGVIIYYILNSLHSTTSLADQVIANTENTTSGYADYNITMYDGEEVRGSEVVNFIKKQLGDYSGLETAPIYIAVVTKISGTTYTNAYTNKQCIDDIKNFSSINCYIKPTAVFSGEVIKSVNKAILGVKFTQK